MKLSAPLLALGLLFAAPVQALLITDTQNPGRFLSQGQSYTVTHDLTGYGVPEDYRVKAAALRLGFSDQQGHRLFDWAADLAKVTGDGISGIFEVDGSHRYGYDIRWLGVGSEGIDALNLSGLLEVTVTAIHTDWWLGNNDFWWKTSKLAAHVESRGVPESGSLALLGVALMALGIRRKRLHRASASVI